MVAAAQVRQRLAPARDLEAGGAQQERVQPDDRVVVLGAGAPSASIQCRESASSASGGAAPARGAGSVAIRPTVSARLTMAGRRIQRRDDPRGELRLAAAVEQHEQLVQVHAVVAGEAGRELRLEAGRDQPAAAPVA